MSFYVTLDNCEIRCDTAAEALALAAQAARVQGNGKLHVKKGAARPAQTAADRESLKRRRAAADQALRFLQAVKEAGEQGIGGASLAKKVGCDGISGLGTVVQWTHRLLDDQELQFDAIVQKKRKGDQKLWYPGGLITEGIVALKNKGIELSKNGDT